MPPSSPFRSFIALLSLSFLAAPVLADAPAKEKPHKSELISDRTAGMEKRGGLLDLYVDREGGKVWLAVPPAGKDGVVGSYIYSEGILTGLGSNPVGLDRGQIGDARLVTLRRVGARLLVEQ